MAGLLDFLLGQSGGPGSNLPIQSPMGLLGNLMRGQQQPAYEPDEQTRALQQQLNRAPVSGMMNPEPLTPSPMAPGSFMPQGAALQPSTQGWTGGDPQDRPAPGAALAGPSAQPPGNIPMPVARPQGLDQPRDIRPPIQAAGMASQPPGAPLAPQMIPGAAPNAQQGQKGILERITDVVGGIYGKGGPGDNLIALGAGIASGGGNWGQGLMRGMALINAQQMQQKKRDEDARRLLGMQNLGAEIDRRRGLPAGTGATILASPNAGAFLQDSFRKQETLRPLTDPAERARLGIPESDKGIYQIDSSGKISAVGTPSTNINMQAETAFDKSAGGKLAESFGKMVEAGDTAASRASDLAMLRDLSGRIGNQGSTANFKLLVGPMANALGIKIDGLDDLQAWNSIIQRIAPQMRAPGSGATSDIEFKGFIQSLPQASQSPQARSMIIETMDSMARDAISRREIAMKVLGKQMSREQADAALKALPSPFESFKQWQQATGQASQSDVPPVQGARKAPDGNWYVTRDGKTYRVQL